MANLAALDSAETKFGQGKIDPQKMRSTNEKITDTAREQFEKVSGYVTYLLPTIMDQTNNL